MVWMLREVELSKLTREDIKIKEDKKHVQLRWKKSKMDQKGPWYHKGIGLLVRRGLMLTSAPIERRRICCKKSTWQTPTHQRYVW